MTLHASRAPALFHALSINRPKLPPSVGKFLHNLRGAGMETFARHGPRCLAWKRVFAFFLPSRALLDKKMLRFDEENG